MAEENKDCMPRLRFPEFREKDKWEYNLGEKVFSNAVEKNSQNLNLPILAITQDKGAVPRNEINYSVIVSDESIKNYKIVRKGDFIISLRTFQGGIEYSSFDGLCSPAYILLRKNKGIKYYDSFFTYYFKTPSFIQSLNKDLTGIRDGKIIPYSHFAKIDLPFPPYKEQQKIADCLSSLDELIEAHEQKRDALVEHKKGLMQRLFPPEGETTPRWRFPEFCKGPRWGFIKLGKITSVAMCKRIFSEETSPIGDIPFYKIGTLGKEPDAFISESLFKKYKSNYKYPRIGEILLTCSGTIGKMIRYSGEDAYYQDSNIVWLENNQERVINTFLFYFLSKFNWNKLNTTTITRIYGDDLKNIVLVYPQSKDEQQKIADCLSSLDARIEAEEAKIASLREHKRGLMQRLFPQSL